MSEIKIRKKKDPIASRVTKLIVLSLSKSGMVSIFKIVSQNSLELSDSLIMEKMTQRGN